MSDCGEKEKILVWQLEIFHIRTQPVEYSRRNGRKAKNMRATILLLAVCALAEVSLASDWAVEVAAGREAADALAAEAGLVNVGEAIPDSNIFHFRLPEDHRRRSKRAADDADSALLSHPSVSSLERQSEPLVRVRRVPVPVPVPQSSSSGSNSELCFLNTEATEKEAARRCVFPFKYKGRSYLECTADHSVNGKQWCATEVSRKLVVNFSSHACKTIV